MTKQTDKSTAFTRKPANPIKRRRHRSKYPFLNLPFIAGGRTKTDAGHWHVSATGGHLGGYRTGQAMAQAFLKFLRERGSPEPDNHLSLIATSFMIRFEQEGGVQMEKRSIRDSTESFRSLRGQYCGFFNTLNYWLTASVNHFGKNLDAVTEQELIRRANEGLGFDEEAYYDDYVKNFKKRLKEG